MATDNKNLPDWEGDWQSEFNYYQLLTQPIEQLKVLKNGGNLWDINFHRYDNRENIKRQMLRSLRRLLTQPLRLQELPTVGN